VIEMQARPGRDLSLNGCQATRVDARNSFGSTTIRIFLAFVSDVTLLIRVSIIHHRASKSSIASIQSFEGI
jgi:hypothetical protein